MEPPVGGFWELSESKGSDNPWINGTLMAPFDQEVGTLSITLFLKLEIQISCGFH